MHTRLLVRFQKAFFAVGLIGVVTCLSGYALFSYWYPYGHKIGYFSQISIDLHTYADEHEGWYPMGRGESASELAIMYYGSDSDLVGVLAGVSGDEQTVRRFIRMRETLPRESSSLEYIPGLRFDDDRRIAVLWERTEGVAANGYRMSPGSHAVMFVDGRTRQVSGEKWEAFVNEQKKLTGDLYDRRTALMTEWRARMIREAVGRE